MPAEDSSAATVEGPDQIATTTKTPKTTTTQS
jgi:hypothetical protein